ncbi:tripartite tricarboxylate transporter substrate binding protein (plasmid) [Cupriavidus sp. P-10]|nr:tripartite tricarboxylate transporter substrate binding protein [Cupriavidus sp. P-10]
MLRFLGAGATWLALPHAQARSWPSKPLKVVLGYATGGSTDATARIICRRLEQYLEQPVVCDYKPGAGASIGAESVARSAPDGYILGLTDSGPMSIMPNLRKLGYDPLKDFTYLSYVCTTGLALIVNPNVRASSVEELVALLRKAKPGEYSYASSGVGSVHHLAGELFKRKAGVALDHIPYRGAGPAMTDLIGGQVPVMMATIGPALPMIAAGKVRALGVTSAKRSLALPEVPTLAERGLPGYEATLRFSMVAPAGLPKEAATRLQGELQKVMADPAVIKELAQLGNDEISARSPAEVAQLTRDDLKKWGTVIREAGITLDS